MFYLTLEAPETMPETPVCDKIFRTRAEAWDALATIVEPFAASMRPVRASKIHGKFITLFTTSGRSTIFRVNTVAVAGDTSGDSE